MFNSNTIIFISIFIPILITIFLLNFIPFNENFLIGGLFTFGFLISFIMIKLKGTQPLINELTTKTSQFVSRQLNILNYKIGISLFVYTFFPSFFQFEFLIVNYKVKTTFNILLNFLKNLPLNIIILILYLSYILINFFQTNKNIIIRVSHKTKTFAYKNIVS